MSTREFVKTLSLEIFDKKKQDFLDRTKLFQLWSEAEERVRKGQ